MAKGRPKPPVLGYICGHCATNKPRIRDNMHVNCSCGAAPNPQLAELLQLKHWPSLEGAVWPVAE